MEQLDRANRYLERIKGIYSGVFCLKGHDKEAFDDDVISFFIHCYHVRDWIIHLNKVGVNARHVDSYIDRHKALRICADLANGSKHCKLTRSLRTDRQPQIAGKERYATTWLSGGGGGEMMRCKYTVLSNSDFIDALELATECMNLWELYVKELRVRGSHTAEDIAN